LKESQFKFRLFIVLYSLRFKAAFVGPEQDPKIFQDIERGNFTFFTFVYLSPESVLTTERWRNMLESKSYQESLIAVAVDGVHCFTKRSRWLGTLCNNKNHSAFRVWYSPDPRSFNYAISMPGDLHHQYGISGHESQTSLFAFRS